MVNDFNKDIVNNLSFYLFMLVYIVVENILSNIHSDMLRIARKTIQMSIIRSEQDSNLHLPIIGRLFYQINYPIFPEVFPCSQKSEINAWK